MTRDSRTIRELWRDLKHWSRWELESYMKRHDMAFEDDDTDDDLRRVIKEDMDESS